MGLVVRLVNLHGLHQRVLLSTLHGSPRRVRARLPARHPLLASSATYTSLSTALSRPSCTGASIRVARLRPAPYAEYGSRLPARHLPILSPSAYAVLAPLLPSKSLHAPGGAMLEMLGHSSNHFSAWYTGPGYLRGPPAHPESISLHDRDSSLPFPLPVPHPEGRC